MPTVSYNYTSLPNYTTSTLYQPTYYNPSTYYQVQWNTSNVVTEVSAVAAPAKPKDDLDWLRERVDEICKAAFG